MTQGLTIRKRVFITVACLLFASTALIGFLTHRYMMAGLREDLKDFAERENRLFSSILAADAEGLERAQIGLARLDPLLRLFADRKKGALLATARPIFSEIRRDNSITHMYFIDPDGTVFLRVHKPEERGDKLARATFLKASTTNRIATGLEMGLNFFSLRCVQPVSYRGKPLGFVEIAEEIDHVFSRVKRINGNDVSLFLTEDFLKSRSTHVTGERVGNYAILYPTDRTVSLRLAAKLLPAMGKALRGFTVTVVDLGGKKYAVGLGPVQDAFGTTVGILFSQKEVTSLFASQRSLVINNVLVFAVTLLASLAFLFLSLQKSFTLFNALRQRILEITSTWDLSKRVVVPDRSHDEIGTLAQAFNSMLTELDEQKRDMKKQLQFLQILMETMPLPIYYKDVEGKYLGCNSAFAALLGMTKEEILGKRVHDVAPRELADEYRKMDAALFAKQEVQVFGFPFLSKGGRRHDVIFYKAPFPNADGTLGGLVGSILDVSEQKRAYQLLMESEQRFRILFDNAVDAIFLHDPDGTFLEVNETACVRLGYSKDDLLRMTPGDIDTPEYAPLVPLRIEQVKRDGHASFESAHRRKDGAVIPVEMNIRIVSYAGKNLVLAVARDITRQKLAEQEKRHLEEELRHSQKMEAIGLLAGGIAHDFNNALTVIIGFGSLADMQMGKDDPLRQNIEQILAAADRAAKLTSSLLAFSRKQRLNPQPLDLCGIIRHMEKFLKRIIGEDIRLQTGFREAHLIVCADSGQIEQVLMNLATNARDAMPNGGALFIEATSAVIDEASVHAHGYGAPGRYALVTMTDSGSGMNKETMQRIFDPFFTTKEFGKGTGLGLSIAYGIVKQHNGFINVYSEPEQGTTFRIYLPLIEAEFEKKANAAEPYPKGGSETILVAEDEPMIRDLVGKVLGEFGYTVVMAEDGEDAVRKFLENREGIQLLLFDMIMPKKNGMEAFREIAAICPEMRALFMSGYTADIIQAKGMLGEEHALIMKPIQPLDLIRKVREVLDCRCGDLARQSL
ncbi:MAG TPA: PAS domain S-box protein [Geobacteraceae bacterium]